jgi:hypothetical protein
VKTRSGETPDALEFRLSYYRYHSSDKLVASAAFYIARVMEPRYTPAHCPQFQLISLTWPYSQVQSDVLPMAGKLITDSIVNSEEADARS